MWKQFKQFAMRGNVVDLAVGVIMGAAFGQIVTSLVNDILMPPLGLIIGGIDFSDFYVNLSHRTYATLADAKKAGAPVISYGLFLNAVIHFLIVALAVFVLVRQVNKLQSRQEEKATLSTQEQLLTEIRDLLKSR